MCLEIYVDAYSGYKANESTRQSVLDEHIFEIEAVEQQWRSNEATFFKVRTTNDKHYYLQYDDAQDQWTLQTDLDGAELLVRSSIELIALEPRASHDAESRITGCERCRPKKSQIPFDWILADVLDKHRAFEFVLPKSAKCPNCRMSISEKPL